MLLHILERNMSDSVSFLESPCIIQHVTSYLLSNSVPVLFCFSFFFYSPTNVCVNMSKCRNSSVYYIFFPFPFHFSFLFFSVMVLLPSCPSVAICPFNSLRVEKCAGPRSLYQASCFLQFHFFFQIIFLLRSWRAFLTFS